MYRLYVYILLLIQTFNVLATDEQEITYHAISENFTDKTDEQEFKFQAITLNFHLSENFTDKTNEQVFGHGWDNLVNENRLPVLASDKMDVINYEPIQQDFLAQLFSHWKTYSEWDSLLLNQGDLEFKFPGVSGSFSSGYHKVKQRRIINHQVTARFQLQFKSQTRGLSLNNLNFVFKKRISEMITLQEEEKNKLLIYYAELLVKDYGTHFIDKVDLGFAIIEEDALSAAKLFSQLHILSAEIDVIANGSSNFFNRINNKTLPDSYNSLITYSNLSGHGYVNSSLVKYLPSSLWSSSEEPAILARYGKTLDKAITPDNFFNYSRMAVLKVQHQVHQAILTYYNANTYPGCLDFKSPNFNVWANMEDGSCVGTKTLDQHFGGAYQTCEGPIGDPDPCTNASIPNIATGNFTCPDSYTEVLLYKGLLKKVVTKPNCVKSCSGFWFFKTCKMKCNDIVSEKNGEYKVYWCSGKSDKTKLETDKVLFGGAFSNETVNCVTAKHSCPPAFREIQFSEGLSMCLSNDNKGAREHMVEINNFSNVSANDYVNFSCSGNYFKRSIVIKRNLKLHFCMKAVNCEKCENLSFPYVSWPPFIPITVIDDDVDNNEILVPTPKIEIKTSVLSSEVIIAIAFVILFIAILVCAILYKYKYYVSKTAVISDYADIDKNENKIH